MALSWAAECFAFLALERDRAPEKRKVGGSTPPLTTRFWASASPLTCGNRAKVMASTAVSRTKIPTKTPQLQSVGAVRPAGSAGRSRAVQGAAPVSGDTRKATRGDLRGCLAAPVPAPFQPYLAGPRRPRRRPDEVERLNLTADATPLRRKRPQRPSPPHLRPHHGGHPVTHATASCIVGVLKCAPWRGKRPRAQRRISHVKRCSARQLQPVAGERWLLAADRRCAYRLGGGVCRGGWGRPGTPRFGPGLIRLMAGPGVTAVQVMNTAIATNWHVAAAHTKA